MAPARGRGAREDSKSSTLVPDDGGAPEQRLNKQKDVEDLLNLVKEADNYQPGSDMSNLRVSKSDDQRTRLLKEVLINSAKCDFDFKVTMRDTKELPGPVRSRPGSKDSKPKRSKSVPDAAGDPSGDLAEVEEDVFGQQASGIEDILLACEEDSSLKGVLSSAGQRIEKLRERLGEEAEPASPSNQAPPSREQVRVVHRHDGAKQFEQQCVEDTTAQFINKWVKYESLDRLEALFSAGSDASALAEAFPVNSKLNPTLLGLTDYVLDHPDEFKRVIKRVESSPTIYVRESKLRMIGGVVLDGRPRPDLLTQADTSGARASFQASGTTSEGLPRSMPVGRMSLSSRIPSSALKAPRGNRVGAFLGGLVSQDTPQSSRKSPNNLTVSP